MDPGIEFAPAAAKEFYERSRSIWLRATNEQPETWRRMVALGGESIANTEGLMGMDRVGVATCPISGWSSSSASISAGYTLKPPLMNMSFSRSVMAM